MKIVGHQARNFAQNYAQNWLDLRPVGLMLSTIR